MSVNPSNSPLASDPKLLPTASVDDNAIYAAGQEGVKTPAIISKPSPRYSEEARQSGIEGVLRVSAVFRTEGSITDIKVVKRLGYGLDEEAIKAARQITFTPGQKDGKPVNVKMTLEYTFHINKSFGHAEILTIQILLHYMINTIGERSVALLQNRSQVASGSNTQRAC
jgi:TonB family protein